MAGPLDMLGLSSIPPGVPTQDYASYLNAQRKSQLAQALMQSSLSPVQQPQVGGSVRGLYVQPRVGALSAASKIAEALMGRKAAQQSIEAESNLGAAMNQAYAAGGQPTGTTPGTPLQAAPPDSGSNTDQSDQGVQPLIQRLPGASLSQTTAAAQPQTTYSPVNPRNPFGAPSDVVMRMAMSDPAKYAEYLRGTPEWQTALAAYGGNQQAAMEALQAKARKEGTIEARGGNFLDIPGVGRILTPNVERGETYNEGPGGTFSATPIGGSQDIAASRAGATTAAQQQNTPHFEPDPFHPGQMHVVYPPAPPAARTRVPPAGPAQNAPGAPAPASALPAPVTPPRPQAPGSPAPAPPNAPPGAARTPNTAADLEQQKKGAESGQDYADQLAKNATSATEVRRSLSELKNLGAQGGVSVSNPAKLELGSYMIAAGMNPKTVGSMLQTDVGALTAASKQTGSLALDSIHDMTSRGTNFDLSTFMRYNPNLNMADPAGFNRVLDFMDKRMQQEVGKHADFAQWSASAPPNRWAIDHPAHWLEQQNALISQGKTNSRPPLATFVKP